MCVCIKAPWDDLQMCTAAIKDGKLDSSCAVHSVLPVESSCLGVEGVYATKQAAIRVLDSSAIV